MPSQSPGSHTFFYLSEPQLNDAPLADANLSELIRPNQGESQLTNSREEKDICLRMQRLRELEQYPDDSVVGVTDASILLEQHPQTVRRLFHDGLLRGRQTRGKNSTIKFRMGDLRRFIRGET